MTSPDPPLCECGLPPVRAWTDASTPHTGALHRFGRGAWAAVIRHGDDEQAPAREIAQATGPSDINRLEALAILHAIRALKEPSCLTIYCDNRNAVDALNRDTGVISGPNGKIYSRIWRRAARHHVRYEWVRSGTGGNADADRLARSTRALAEQHHAQAQGLVTG